MLNDIEHFGKPMSLKDLDCNEYIKKKFIFLRDKSLVPNLLISGPPGSGKSTTIDIFTKEIFGSEYKSLVLLLNASDNRGIGVIRNKIKDFCRQKIISIKYSVKVIILDEADSLTETAQEALRRIMENFSENSRFILICNFPSKIIEPIQSRCTILVFKYPNFEELLNFLVKKFEKKKKKYNLYKLEWIIYFSDGDFRNILKEIEYSEDGIVNKVTQNVKNLLFIGETIGFSRFLSSCKNHNFTLGFIILQKMWNRGVSGLDIIHGIFKNTKNLFIKETLKFKILNLLCDLRFKLTTNCHFEKILLSLINNLKLIF